MHKKQIKANLSQKLNDANEKLLKLKYQMLMRYTYEKNIPLLMSKLRQLKNKEDVDLKEIFNLIIAKIEIIYYYVFIYQIGTLMRLY